MHTNRKQEEMSNLGETKNMIRNTGLIIDNEANLRRVTYRKNEQLKCLMFIFKRCFAIASLQSYSVRSSGRSLMRYNSFFGGDLSGIFVRRFHVFHDGVLLLLFLQDKKKV